MKKTFHLVSTLRCALFASVAAIGLSTFAAGQPPPSDAPPKINPADDAPLPLTHLDKAKQKQKVETVNEGGQTKVKVTNRLGTYIVKPNDNVGTSLPGDAQSSSNNPVQWVVKSWGGDKSTNGSDDQPATLQPNPNPPRSK